VYVGAFVSDSVRGYVGVCVRVCVCACVCVCVRTVNVIYNIDIRITLLNIGIRVWEITSDMNIFSNS